MNNKRKILNKVLSLALCFAIVLSTTISLGGDDGKAEAKTSLPYIESLKTTSSTFNILEIIPAVGQGSIGYYIAGQEPCANWTYDVAAISGQTARKDYMNKSSTGLLTKLTSANLLGTGDTTPLESIGAYNEVYPWQSHPAPDYTKLTLNSAEQTTANGTFVPAADGAYTQSTGFIPQENGAYVQVIKKFAAGTIGTGQYCYVPTFAAVSTSLPDNTAVYTNTATINDSSATPTDDGYVYYGTTGAGFQGMEIGTKYYYVTSIGAPSTTKPADPDEAKKCYVGISDAYRLKTAGETGYFNINAAELIYTYVGTGGTYNFNYDAGSTTVNNVKSNVVYYTGGYKNNNWFLRNVFDWDIGDATPNIKLKVTSVVGSSATTAQVSAASLIVLSYGFVPGGSAYSYMATHYNDISTGVSTQIQTAVSSKIPVIVDNRLVDPLSISIFTNLYSLSVTLKNFNTKTTFVNNNTFFFAPDATRTALVSNNFRTLYTASDYNVSTGAFYPAYEVAVYENFIRDQEGSTVGHLETDVNMARAIRYIINYKGQRTENEKSGISVLFLAPTTPSTTQVNTLKTNIYSWTTIPTASIAVTPMSTLEFVGKSDDLIESYDMIYIGNAGGTSVSKLDANYVYENIGAPVTIREDAVGLVDSEYSSSTFTGTDGKTYNTLLNPQTTRYSGNDLSTKKLTELNDYAISGHPVIIADGLTAATTITANIKGERNGTTSNALFTAWPTLVGITPSVSPTYQWYYINTLGSTILIAGATSPTCPGTDSRYQYFCKITYTISGTAYTATSDALSFTSTAGYSTASPGTGSQTGSYYGLYRVYVYGDSSVSGNLANNVSTKFTAYVTYDKNPSATDKRVFTLYKDSFVASTGNTTTTPLYTTTVTGNSANYTLDVSTPGSNNYDYYYWKVQLFNSSNVEISNFSTSNRWRVSHRKNGFTLTDMSDDSNGEYSAVSFTPSATPTTGTSTSSQTLTAYANASTAARSVTYQWYRDGSPIAGATNYTLSVNHSSWSGGETHSYYCLVTEDDTYYGGSIGYANTNTIILTRTDTKITVSNNGGSAPVGVPPQTGQSFSINGGVVDNCSNMYSFLNSSLSRANFMRSGAIDKDALQRYVNTSKPIISFANPSCYPTVYVRNATTLTQIDGYLHPDPDGDSDTTNDTYTLKYDFTINNPTDTTPLTTTYYCNLYIDTDSDSRFIEQERIGNIEIREAASGVAGKLVDSGTLKAGQEYIVTRKLSAGMDGFLPWKLELIKASDNGVHTSVTNYTYVKPKDPEVINVLQINTGSGSGLPLDATQSISDTGISATRTTILGLLDKISADYDINIQTITTTQARDIVAHPITNTIVLDKDKHTHEPYTIISELIYSYDMVIIGFDDCYSELDEETSAAIVDYLKHNHPIFYSHDTTSMSNVPQVYDTTSQSLTNYQSTGTYWGYYFNSILRDPLGLDRYGVTNSVFGLTSKSSPLPNTKTSGLVAAAYAGLDAAKTKVLLDEGYSIAYLPGSNTSGTGGTPIGTTQGLTNYMYSGNLTSEDVTQVNKGMITTYPFDLNLSAGSKMTIRPTHQQYYQANMNPDDVTVWYCLSDGGANYAYNDAMSAYYIFSNGNATYSGFGHNLKNIGTDEAMLFVNSIIAAYRVTKIPPVVTFTDASGKTPLNEYLIPADLTGTLLPATGNASVADTSRNLYFTVNDSNVAKDKTVKAVVSYIDPTSGAQVVPDPHIPIYNSQTNEVVTDLNLVSDLAYYVNINDILTWLKYKNVTIGESGLTAQVTVTTHLRGEDMTPVMQPITLRKLMLFDLG